MSQSSDHEKPRIGILTSGGDCPGLNAVIRAVTSLTAQKTKIAEIYSEDYDASDAAIAAELEKSNPWA